MDRQNLETVVCTNCKRSSSFPKGTIADAAKATFVCDGCTRGTVETRVVDRQHAGKNLLTED